MGDPLYKRLQQKADEVAMRIAREKSAMIDKHGLLSEAWAFFSEKITPDNGGLLITIDFDKASYLAYMKQQLEEQDNEQQ